MLRQYIVVPIYWGESFAVVGAPIFNLFDMNNAIERLMTASFAPGLLEYGVGNSTMLFTLDIAPGELPVGSGFSDDQIHQLIADQINAGRVPAPDTFGDLIPFYVVVLRQGLTYPANPAFVGEHSTQELALRVGDAGRRPRRNNSYLHA